jgi:hypothetical protein
MTKPDGFAYTNTQDDYEWLSIAVTQARWQGVIPFEALGDNRADPPTIYRKGELPKFRTISHGPIGLDTLHNMLPTAIGSIPGKQRYLLAIFGEKSSLGSELRPVADQYGADLYLATGELSVTQAYLMARDAAQDGRELVLFTVADFDPSGHQMTVSIARKLRALKDLKFPMFKYRVVPVALTLAQCNAYDLPSEPLKKGEPRKDKWLAAMGREQTEVDAMLGRLPGTLANIVSEAIAPYYDVDIMRAARAAETKWLAEAQAAIDTVVTDQIKMAFTRRYNKAVKALETIDDDLKELCRNVVMPPLPELDDEAAMVDVDDTVVATTEWDLVEESRELKARKKY